MSLFKKFLLERDSGLYDDLVGFDPQSKRHTPEPEPEPKPEPVEPKSSKKEPEKTNFSRRGFLGAGAAALGLGALGGVLSSRRDKPKVKHIAPAFRDDEDDELPDHYDDEHHDEKDMPQQDKPVSSSGTSPSRSRPDPEAYLKSLGPVRRIMAKNDPNSYYHQIGGEKHGLIGRILGRRKR
jgi:hypothetical protein